MLPDHADTSLRRDGVLHECLIRLVEMRALRIVAWWGALLRLLFQLYLLRLLLEPARVLRIKRAVCAPQEMRHILVLCLHVENSLVTGGLILDTKIADLVEQLFRGDAPYRLQVLQGHIFLYCRSSWLAFVALLSLQRCVFLCHES